MLTVSHADQPAQVIVVGSRRDGAGAGRQRLTLLGLLLLALLALAYVRQASLVATAGYDLQDLQAVRQRRLATVEQLRFQLAEARALERVAREAERRGLGPPEQVIYVRVAPSPEPVPSPPVLAGQHGTRLADNWLDELSKWLRSGR